MKKLMQIYRFNCNGYELILVFFLIYEVQAK